MLLDPIQALSHGFAETKRCRRIAHLHQVVPELPDDIALGTRKKLWRLLTWFPCPVIGGHAIRFHCQATPERLVSLNGVTGLQAVEKKSLQFILSSFEVGDGHSLYNGEDGVQSLLGGTIRPRVDDRLDSPFLFGSELKSHGMLFGAAATTLHLTSGWPHGNMANTIRFIHPILDLTPGDPIIRTYIKDLQRLKDHQVAHELGLKSSFQNLLDKAAKKRGWTLVPELSTHSGGKRVVPDGTVRDEFRLARGWWEAKDTSDNLAAEIQKKLKAGYPTRNTIFEDTQLAVLYQDGAEAGEFDLAEPVKVAGLLNRFISYRESDKRDFERAMEDFQKPHSRRRAIPACADRGRTQEEQGLPRGLRRIRRHRPRLAEPRAFRRQGGRDAHPALAHRAPHAQPLPKPRVHSAQRHRRPGREGDRRACQRQLFAGRVPPETRPLLQGRRKGRFESQTLHREQDFLNSVYEQFFQKFSPDIADTHGIVYTPREIVDYMCSSVERAPTEEFGFTLASPEVVILDPCTGTGNFIVNLIERMPGNALAEAYLGRFFANEVMLLPYYVSSLNIEHAYFEKACQYQTFDGLCFVDTLDMAGQGGLFAPENTKRVERERDAAITVIIGFYAASTPQVVAPSK